MTALREGLPPLPDTMRDLLVDVRGYPVPRFVQWIDGQPEFRVMDAEHLLNCIKFNLCWVCGKKLGFSLVFVVGPMCAVNRISAEPPSHLKCAEFSVQACPWLTLPKALRRETGLPAGATNSPGFIARNPGVSVLWCTKQYRVIRNDSSLLFKMGSPRWVICYAQKRLATPEEVIESFESGLPALLEQAQLKSYADTVQIRQDIKNGRGLLGIR